MKAGDILKILVVDDEPAIVDLINLNLQLEGFESISCNNGFDAIKIAKSQNPDLILLDIMMPGLDGFQVCKALQKLNIPIILLTARNSIKDKLCGLELGADDYITKPFNILEVKARIKAIMRRSSKKEAESAAAKVVTHGGLKIDCESRRVYVNNKEVNLTAKEFDLLELLIFNPNKVYSRENLLNTVWGYDYPGDVRTVDVHVRRLREKIEDNPSEPKYIHTKWGVGYFFQD